jgi:hypothetical protein
MRTSCAPNRPTAAFIVAVLVALNLNSFDRLHGISAEFVSISEQKPSSDQSEELLHRPGVCRRNAEQLVGQKAVAVDRSVEAPKKIRNVSPKYPELPQDTRGSGGWLGEVLVSQSGKVARVWPLREVRFTPSFPAFNTAITDAIQQWEYEPLLVRGKAVPLCITVSINIDWQ